MARSSERRLNEDHDVRQARLREWVRTGLWFVPGASVAAALVLGWLLHEADKYFRDRDPPPFAFTGEPEVAQQLLGTIATSTITLAGLILSITIVALQLSSSQFSPRVLRTFLRDTGTKVPFGVFAGSFVYALLVLRTVHPGSPERSPFVPGISISVAFVGMLLALAAFVFYVDHIAKEIRVVAIIERVARETRESIDENYPDAEPTEPGSCPVTAPDQILRLPADKAPGALLGVDEDDLVATARHHGCVLHLVPSVGDYVPYRSTVFEVWGSTSIDEGDVVPHIGIGPERTMYQDVAFGFRQLVDIAEKALSPAINDPTTAVQALDRIHDLLLRLGTRPFPSGCHRDAAGAVRFMRPVAPFAYYVDLAFAEISQYGSDSIQVQRRLRSIVDDLLTVVSAERRPPLELVRERLGAPVA